MATSGVEIQTGIGASLRPDPRSFGGEGGADDALTTSGSDRVADGLWVVRDRTVDLGRPVVMGILNLTPDSFSDGGDLADLSAALQRADRMIEEGVDILDVGGESTRPGAEGVDEKEERARVLPFVHEAVARYDVPISIDTRKTEVARAALDAGAHIVNDVSALEFDGRLGSVVADAGAGVVLMHMRGEPGSMNRLASYEDVVREVLRELELGVARARSAGISDEAIVLDPGIGFAKDTRHNLTLLADLGRVVDRGFPVMVGPSRKRFLGELLELPPEERIEGTIAACTAALLHGARLFRVHDVGPVRRALTVAEAVRTAAPVQRPGRVGP